MIYSEMRILSMMDAISLDIWEVTNHGIVWCMRVTLHCKGSTVEDTDMVKPLHVWKGQSLELGLLTGCYDRFTKWVFCVVNKLARLQEIFSPVSVPLSSVPVLDLWVLQPEVVTFVVNFHLFCAERLRYHATSDFSICVFFFLIIINTNITASWGWSSADGCISCLVITYE